MTRSAKTGASGRKNWVSRRVSGGISGTPLMPRDRPCPSGTRTAIRACLSKARGRCQTKTMYSSLPRTASLSLDTDLLFSSSEPHNQGLRLTSVPLESASINSRGMVQKDNLDCRVPPQSKASQLPPTRHRRTSLMLTPPELEPKFFTSKSRNSTWTSTSSSTRKGVVKA